MKFDRIFLTLEKLVLELLALNQNKHVINARRQFKICLSNEKLIL
jgi:hypothetical protein